LKGADDLVRHRPRPIDGRVTGAAPPLEEFRRWPDAEKEEFVVRLVEESREYVEQSLAYVAAFRDKVGEAAFERMLADPDPKCDGLRSLAELEPWDAEWRHRKLND
jgi:hypothetical protein